MIVLLFGVFYFIFFLYNRDIVSADFLNRKLFSFRLLENCCSARPVSHFILYTLLGYFYPYCWKLAITTGVIWELVEVVAHHVTGGERQPTIANGNVEYSTNWWAGTSKDIVMNTTGFLFGSAIRDAVDRAKDSDDEDNESFDQQIGMYS